MVDPITIIGTAGALANILDVLTKTIYTVADLRSQWSNADLAIVTLESQLAALTMALREIKAWAETNPEATPHSQLGMDLDRCIICCSVLVSRMGDEVSRLGTTEKNVLERSSKFRLLIKTNEFRNVQRMIDQQTGALTLLLTACNATTNEQRKMLEKTTTRQIFKKLQDDTASLYVLRDVDSIVTVPGASTIASSKRSIHFNFDSELLTTRIYQLWMRGSVRKKLWRQQGDTRFEDHVQVNKKDGTRFKDHLKSSELDEVPSRGEERQPYDGLVLLLGSESRLDVTRKIIFDAETRGGGDDMEPPEGRLPAVHAEFLWSVCELAAAIRALDTPPKGDDPIWTQIRLIERGAEMSPEHFPCKIIKLSPRFFSAVRLIQETGFYSDAMDGRGHRKLPETAKYFLSHLDRISQQDYLPSVADLLKTSPSQIGGYRLALTNKADKEGLCLVDPGNDFLQTLRWSTVIPSCKVFAFIFVFDLDTYDKSVNGESELSRSLALFRQIVESTKESEPFVVLILNKFRGFQRKLEREPMVDILGEGGGDDWKEATGYITRLFRQLGGALFPIATDSDAGYPDLTKFFLEAINTRVQDALLKDAGIVSREGWGSPPEARRPVHDRLRSDLPRPGTPVPRAHAHKKASPSAPQSSQNHGPFFRKPSSYTSSLLPT